MLASSVLIESKYQDPMSTNSIMSTSLLHRESLVPWQCSDISTLDLYLENLVWPADLEDAIKDDNQ